MDVLGNGCNDRRKFQAVSEGHSFHGYIGAGDYWHYDEYVPLSSVIPSNEKLRKTCISSRGSHTTAWVEYHRAKS